MSPWISFRVFVHLCILNKGIRTRIRQGGSKVLRENLAETSRKKNRTPKKKNKDQWISVNEVSVTGNPPLKGILLRRTALALRHFKLGTSSRHHFGKSIHPRGS